MNSVLQITIPCKPLSTNHIYGRSKFGVFLTKEAKDFKIMVKQIIGEKRLMFDESKHYVSVEMYVYLNNFFTKAGKINKKSGDFDNFKKLLIDSIFDHIGINDALVCDGLDRKRYGAKDQTVIILKLERLEGLAQV